MNDLLVSCLMVTLPSATRSTFIRDSIQSYQHQTHANKELVIILNGGTEFWTSHVERYVEGLNDPSIRIIKLPGNLSLGALRNESIRFVAGDVICQWDDDDLYHPERITEQLALLIGSECDAVFLGHVIQLFSAEGTAYVTNWARTETRAFPGSIMCLKSCDIEYPQQGSESRLGEDTHVARRLLATKKVNMVTGKPYLYIYRTHGTNSWSNAHHLELIQSLAISRGLLMRHQAEIISALSEYRFELGTIRFCGPGGEAFVYKSHTPTETCKAPNSTP